MYHEYGMKSGESLPDSLHFFVLPVTKCWTRANEWGWSCATPGSHVGIYRECTFCTLKLFTDYQTTCKCHVNFWYHHTCILHYSPSHSRKRIRIWLSKWQNWVTKSLWVQCILVYRYCTHFMKVYTFTHVLCSKFLSWENIFGNFKFFQQFHKSFSPTYLNTASL